MEAEEGARVGHRHEHRTRAPSEQPACNGGPQRGDSPGAPRGSHEVDMADRRTMVRSLTAFGASALMGGAIAGATLVGGTAAAQDARGMGARMAADPDVAEAQMEAREARAALREARRMPRGEDRDDAVDEAQEDVEEATEETLEARNDAREERLEERHERRTDARGARRERWNGLRGRLGVDQPASISPPVRAELRLHARRMAKLTRIEALADEADDDANEERAERLMTRERARHEARIAALTNRGAAAEAEVE